MAKGRDLKERMMMMNRLSYLYIVRLGDITYTYFSNNVTHFHTFFVSFIRLCLFTPDLISPYNHTSDERPLMFFIIQYNDICQSLFKIVACSKPGPLLAKQEILSHI